MESLKKYKKKELIELVMEYEEEIHRLTNEAENNVERVFVEDKINDKTTEYLKKKIRCIQDNNRNIYIIELERINNETK